MVEMGDLTPEQVAQLRGLEGRVPDVADIPEAPAEHWATARRGGMFRVRKEAVSLRIDMDVLEWLRGQGPGYQTVINRILRERMEGGGR